jgi:adenosine deaminase
MVPKAELHLHQEVLPRLAAIAARRAGRPGFDWRGRSKELLSDTAPGMARLSALFTLDRELDLAGVSPDAPDSFVAMVEQILDEAAVDGAVLVEVRCGPSGVAASPAAMVPLFREAERRVQQRHPRLRAEVIAYVQVSAEPAARQAGERRIEECVAAAELGLAGVDFAVYPYETEAPAVWEAAYDWGARAARAGLGVTVHSGEFSTGGCAAALRVPGLRRIGHAVHYADDPRLLDDLVASGVTAECCPTCNVALGAVPSYEAHPLRRLADRGVPVTLSTDLPARLGITIAQEYAAASSMGFSDEELRGLTRNAVRASFMPAERREELLAELA